MSQQMAKTAAPTPRRRTEIKVIGNNNLPVEGADIQFIIDGTLAGSVMASRGRASILPPPVYYRLDVTATYQSSSESVTLTPAMTQATIALSVPGDIVKSFLPTTPTCPDGTTNQPCVDCVVNGISIQICA